MAAVADLYAPTLRHPDPPTEVFDDDDGSGGGGGGGGTGSGTVTSWDGTGSKPSITGEGYLLGKGAVDGLYWKKTTAGTNNTDWVPV